MALRGTPFSGALVADDCLHPSGKQYRRWTDAIVPVIEDLLRD